MVKLKYYVIIMALLVLVPYGIEQALANIGTSERVELISKEKVDVTGDGIEDCITISGERYDEDSPFYRTIFLNVTPSNGPTFHLPLDGGYSPVTDFADLNNDGVIDVFVTIDSGGSGGIQYYQGYSFKNNKLKDLGSPPPVNIYGQFLDDYKAEIRIEKEKVPVIIDLSARKKEYDEMGLYIGGKLSEPTELMVDPYASMLIRKNEKNKTILIGSQLVSGAYHADSIATVESTWIWKKNRWQLVNTKVKERK